MEGSSLSADVSSTLVESPHVGPGCSMISLGINHDISDFIWENVKEVVAIVLEESFVAFPVQHVLEITIEAATPSPQLVFLWNVQLSSGSRIWSLIN